MEIRFFFLILAKERTVCTCGKLGNTVYKNTSGRTVRERYEDNPTSGGRMTHTEQCKPLVRQCWRWPTSTCATLILFSLQVLILLMIWIPTKDWMPAPARCAETTLTAKVRLQQNQFSNISILSLNLYLKVDFILQLTIRHNYQLTEKWLFAFWHDHISYEAYYCAPETYKKQIRNFSL